MNDNSEKQKALNAWNKLKFLIHSQRISPKVNEGEVWWCSMWMVDKSDMRKVKDGFIQLYC